MPRPLRSEKSCKIGLIGIVSDEVGWCLPVRPYGPSDSPESGLTGRHLKPIVSELRWPQTRLS